MYKEITRKSIYLGVFILCLIAVISCEKDFQDINSSVIKNTKFETKDTVLEIVVTNKAISSVRGDALEFGGTLSQYLLGVYNNPDYEKIEASIVSQLLITPGLKLVNKTYGADTIVVTTIDTVFLKLPYQATLKEKNSTKADFRLDSIIGDVTKPFSLNIYEIGTYLNKLDPQDPSKNKYYPSDFNYQKIGSELNETVNYQFIPNANDTIFRLKRRTNTGVVYKDSIIELTNKSPFARIPLSKSKIKKLFLDEYGTPQLATQEAFNEYFKGLIIEASGNEGSLISFSISSSDLTLKPSIEIYYTNTVLKGGTTINDTIKTISKSNSFLISNFSNSVYKMTDKVYPADKNVIVQGTAGNMAQVELFGADANNNNIPDQLEELRTKNWLINDASLTFYVNQDIVKKDTIATPYSLFLYKDNGTSKPSQIKDIFSEGPIVYGGNLEIKDSKPNLYTFKITDYISDLFNNKSSYSPTLNLKAFNTTDLPTSVTDTIVRVYSWSPKAVTLLNHDKTANGERRARLKISYTIKK